MRERRCTRRRARQWTVAVPIAGVLVLSGCGGGGGGSAEQGDGQEQAREQAQEQRQEQAVEGRRIDVASGDFYFDPAEIRVQRGETVTLVVTNDGSLTHNISIDAFGVKEDFPPGQTAYVTITPEQTGNFEIYCDEPGHTEAGMVGTLIVE